MAQGPFDLAKLVLDVQRGVLKRLSDEEVHRVVELAVQDIEDNLTQLAQELSPAERRVRAPSRLAIMDSDIRKAVEGRLRTQPTRIAHVLYALSTLGRSDREGRLGFRSAADVIEWMDADGNYPDLNTGKRPHTREVPTDVWWPSGLPPMPGLIIKRNLSTRSFGMGQFQTSIAMAMTGRPNAAKNSKNVAYWVLWGLAGQEKVLSAQLAVGAMDCLRRVDDIAYLRWAAVAKNVASVTDFRKEAASLIEHPSTRLVFDVQAAPRRPKTEVLKSG